MFPGSLYQYIFYHCPTNSTSHKVETKGKDVLEIGFVPPIRLHSSIGFTTKNKPVNRVNIAPVVPIYENRPVWPRNWRQWCFNFPVVVP